MDLWINGKKFRGLMDTGVDVSVISFNFWPQNWPCDIANVQLSGIGQATSPLQSSAWLTWRDADNHSGNFRPFILPNLPVNLCGRDVLAAMGTTLVIPSTSPEPPF